MFIPPHKQPQIVSKRGAAAGCVLQGTSPNNQGLRLRVLQQQEKGAGGPLKGRFVILDLGDNKHSQSLAALLHKTTDAAEVVGVLRRRSPSCVNVANTNILALEERSDVVR